MTMSWKNEFSVGIQALDGEHKKIINMINALDGAIGRPEEQRIVQQSLSAMAEYVGRHFRAEEDAMHLAGYKLLEPHRKTHNDFTAVVMGLARRKNLEAAELQQILVNWLTEHILKIDKDYAESVSSWMNALKRQH